MMHPLAWCAGALFMAAAAVAAGAVAPTPDEMKTKDAWVRACLLDGEERPAPGVLVAANHGDIGKDARGKGLLRFGATEYKKGLLC